MGDLLTTVGPFQAIAGIAFAVAAFFFRETYRDLRALRADVEELRDDHGNRLTALETVTALSRGEIPHRRVGDSRASEL